MSKLLFCQHLKKPIPCCSTTDKVVNLFINKHGNCKEVLASLQGMERYFSNRLDELAGFLARQFKLNITSWHALTTATTSALERPEYTENPSISLAYLWSQMDDKASDPALQSPAKPHRKTRHNK